MGLPAAVSGPEPAGRPGALWRLLAPDLWAPHPDAIDLGELARRGIRCLLVDVDNTLAPWGERRLDDGARRFVGRARRAGLRVVILSNSGPSRRAWAASSLGVPAAPGVKPLPGSLRRAARLVGCRPRETAVVGDQLWTDVLGARLAGMWAVLVDPLHEREHLLTRLGRRVEALCLRRMARGGWVSPERVAARLGRRAGRRP